MHVLAYKKSANQLVTGCMASQPGCNIVRARSFNIRARDLRKRWS